MATDAELGLNIKATDNVSKPLKLIQSSVIRFVGAVTASLAALKAVAFPISAAVNFQKEMQNVQKTTEFSDIAIKNLGSSLIELSTNTDVAAQDLAKIASIAGQLGLGSAGAEAILAFTEATARFATVLDVSAEKAAESIAKITNIFQIAVSDAENITAAFNEVSNNSTIQKPQQANLLGNFHPPLFITILFHLRMLHQTSEESF